MLLDRVCNEIGACSAVVQAFAFDGEHVRVGWQAMDTRTSRHQARPEAQLSAVDNPRMDRRRSLRGLQRIVRDDELFNLDDPARDQLKRRLAHIGTGRFMGKQPLDNGLLVANSAASIWCGFRSTCASSGAPAMRSMESAGPCKVSLWAKYASCSGL